MAMNQTIGFCTSRDGTRIATAVVGKGPPLVRAAHWLSHVEYDVTSPIWLPWLRLLSTGHRYLRYDQRGCGLSDREVADFSLDAMVDDLEAVTRPLASRPFPLIGMSQGGAIAIAFALRYPERVSRLLLVGAYGRGSYRRPTGQSQRREAEALLTLVRVGWGRQNAAFRQVFTSQFIPDGTPQQHRWWTELEQRTASPETAAAILEAFYRIDVTELATKLDLPVLVMHSRGDARIPFDEGRLLASLIPGARFVPLDSDNHVLLEGEPAWSVFCSELRGFVDAGHGADPVAGFEDLTHAERQVLAILAEGHDNATIASRLAKSEKTVRNQVSSILGKTGIGSRAALIVRAREALDIG